MQYLRANVDSTYDNYLFMIELQEVALPYDDISFRLHQYKLWSEFILGKSSYVRRCFEG